MASKDQALAYLNQTIGKSLLKSSPAEAIPYLLKAARLESELKKNAQLYLDISNAYGEVIAKLAEDYKAKFTDETPESKLAAENINQMIDRQIDSLARAVALTTNPAGKKALMDVLTGLYNDRHKNTTGLDQMLAGVLSTPIPDVPVPATLPVPPIPAATPAATPAAMPGATPAATPTAAPAATPTASPKATPATTPKATPKPSPSPTPSRP
jgi:hypothetical protein